MFTDIEGSTRLLAALGDQYADVLADHRRLVRAVVAAAGGVEVDTQGDAFMVAFSDAGPALAAAIGIQRSMSCHSWPRSVSVLVRIGLHTGTPLRAGDGYVGLDLHRGARICAAGHGGQVVLSDRTRTALGTWEIGSAELRPLGAHLLKDLDEPLVLFEVRADGLGETFPPLRSIGARPTDHGAVRDPVIGRDGEAGEARSPVRDGPEPRAAVGATSPDTSGADIADSRPGTSATVSVPVRAALPAPARMDPSPSGIRPAPDTPPSASAGARRWFDVPLLAVVVAVSVCIAAVVLVTASDSGGDGERARNGTAQGAVRGGTLNILGAGDVDYLDPNVAYYPVSYAVARLYSRQLFTNPADPAASTTAVPDLAEAIPTVDNGGISPDGRTYTIVIRQGAQWNTAPHRQVTAADVVTGIKRTCNPVHPFGGLSNYLNLIAGFAQFCEQFAGVAQDAQSIKRFIQATRLPGVAAVDDRTIVFTLNSTATYFVDMLTLPAMSPAPVELLDYLPGSTEMGQHMISDGPYEIDLYEPTRRIELSRNPAWNAATDPVRGAFVDNIVIDQTLTQGIVQQQLQAGTPGADLQFDVATPAYQVADLLSANDPNLLIGPAGSSSSYIIYNFRSPNNHGALADINVRRAISHAINRAAIIQVLGGPEVSPPLTHVLPPGILGSQDFDPYPFDPDRARRLLAEAGYPHGVTLKVLYRAGAENSGRILAGVQHDLAEVGITVEAVPSSDDDFYLKYLQVPDVAARGVWDLSLVGWGSDWYGNAAVSYFNPLFLGQSSFPPMGSNFGFYDSGTANTLIQQAGSATDQHAATTAWSRADRQVMADAAIYPITNPRWAAYHAAHVHNAVFLDVLQGFDPANVWLSPDKNGG